MHGKVQDNTFSLEVPGETLIALHNALSFTLIHQEEYSEEVEFCEHCIEAMNAVKRQVSHILSFSEVYDSSNKKLLN